MLAVVILAGHTQAIMDMTFVREECDICQHRWECQPVKLWRCQLCGRLGHCVGTDQLLQGWGRDTVGKVLTRC